MLKYFSVSLQIYSVGIDGTNEQEVISVGLQNPVGVAVDWIGNKLYFTDRTGKNKLTY